MNTRLKVTIDVECEEKGFHVCSNLTKDDIHPDELSVKEMFAVYVAVNNFKQDMEEHAESEGVDFKKMLKKEKTAMERMVNWVMGYN